MNDIQRMELALRRRARILENAALTFPDSIFTSNFAQQLRKLADEMQSNAPPFDDSEWWPEELEQLRKVQQP